MYFKNPVCIVAEIGARSLSTTYVTPSAEKIRTNKRAKLRSIRSLLKQTRMRIFTDLFADLGRYCSQPNDFSQSQAFCLKILTPTNIQVNKEELRPSLSFIPKFDLGDGLLEWIRYIEHIYNSLIQETSVCKRKTKNDGKFFPKQQLSDRCNQSCFSSPLPLVLRYVGSFFIHLHF